MRVRACVRGCVRGCGVCVCARVRVCARMCGVVEVSLREKAWCGPLGDATIPFDLHDALLTDPSLRSVSQLVDQSGVQRILRPHRQHHSLVQRIVELGSLLGTVNWHSCYSFDFF